MLSAFIILNITLFYTIITAVAVITDNKITEHSFLSPQGREYSYNDVVQINAGVYGEKSFLHSKGDFYYIIELYDGTKIDLAETGGSIDDPRFIIENIDIQLVNMGVRKVSSMDNVELINLHPIYVEKIRNVLENTNM